MYKYARIYRVALIILHEIIVIIPRITFPYAIFFKLLWHVSRKRDTNARFNIAFCYGRILLNEEREPPQRHSFKTCRLGGVPSKMH